MPLILPGNVGSATAATGYDVANSCRFDGSSAYMHKTPSSEGDKQKFTFSTWVKRSLLGVTTAVDQHLISADAGNTETYIFFLANSGSGADAANTDCLSVYSTDANGDIEMSLRTSPIYRDPSAWMHVCVAIDTTQGTDTNRAKIYVNGSQISSFSLATYPAQNENLAICDDVIHEIARRPAGTTKYFNGYLAETVLIDGQQLAPTSFGEFDSDSGIWKPIDVSGLTAGTNGFYLDYEDSGNLGNDVFGGTDLTEVNLAATDQSTDTCTNNFATLNPLHYESRSNTFAEGNLKITGGSSDAWDTHYGLSTIAVSTGKWFVESKVTTVQSAQAILGILSTSQAINSSLKDVGRATVEKEGRITVFGSNAQTGLTAFSNGDIAGLAFDATNGTAQFYRNGSAYGSAISSIPSDTYYFATTTYQAGGVIEFNFGSPPYSESGGNSDGSGFGNFSMAVPSGYFALNTKNLAEYGG